jgi:osmotically-inducible protein OsmY
MMRFTTDSPVETLSLAEAVEMRLARNLLSHKYELRVEELNGIIQLRGNVDRYYDKQLAQKVAMEVPGVTGLDNQLEVRCSR